VALVVAVATIGCGEDAATDRGATGPVTLDLEPSAVLVSEESALIAEAVDIEVDDRGNVLVVDYRTPQVLIVPPNGGEPTVVGRGGEGPGEFRFPRAIGGAGGIVYVFDVSRGNVQPVLRNEAIPMLAANGDVWVFQQTEAVLERFDLEGARLASTQLELPEQPAILASFEERNANLGPGTTFPLAPLPVRQRREQHCGDRFAGGRRFLIARQSWSPIGRTRAFPSRGEGNPGGSLPSSAPIG